MFLSIMLNKINLRFVIGAALLITPLVILFLNDFSSFNRQSKRDKIPTFHDIGIETGTDKVTYHKYECVYEDALAPYRHIPGLKILEIGLGCTMNYGPGASYHLWSKYFDDAQVYFLEYDRSCGEKWAKSLESLRSAVHETGKGNGKKVKLPIMSYGDQADPILLGKMAAEHGPWDIIVDDGGHTMNQQITSFKHLFPAVKPGGIYFLEDLSTSFAPQLGGTVTGVNSPRVNTSISLIAQIFADSISVNLSWNRRIGVGSEMDKLTCCDEICAFRVKRK